MNTDVCLRVKMFTSTSQNHEYIMLPDKEELRLQIELRLLIQVTLRQEDNTALSAWVQYDHWILRWERGYQESRSQRQRDTKMLCATGLEDRERDHQPTGVGGL